MFLSFPVGRLLGKPQGSREKFDFTEPLAFDEDGLMLKAPVSGKVELLKLPHEINVQVKDLRTESECQCCRCLKIFICPIAVPLAEREFIILGETKVSPTSSPRCARTRPPSFGSLGLAKPDPRSSRGEFVLRNPQVLEPGEEVFYLEKGRREISLDDMVREEILLHFPGIPLCSESCKGLCDRCGTNLNEKSCDCKS